MHTKSNLYAYKFEFECTQQNTLYEQVTKIRSNNRANSSTKPLFYTSMRLQRCRTTECRKENYRRECRAPYTRKSTEQRVVGKRTIEECVGLHTPAKVQNNSLIIAKLRRPLTRSSEFFFRADERPKGSQSMRLAPTHNLTRPIGKYFLKEAL